MGDLKTQLEDPQRRTEILEKLEAFVEPTAKQLVGRVAAYGVIDDPNDLKPVYYDPEEEPENIGFNPFVDDPIGAWDFEQILEAVPKQGWTLLTHHHDDWVTADIILKHDAGRSISETATGPLAHRYAVIAAVLEKLKGEE